MYLDLDLVYKLEIYKFEQHMFCFKMCAKFDLTYK